MPSLNTDRLEFWVRLGLRLRLVVELGLRLGLRVGVEGVID